MEDTTNTRYIVFRIQIIQYIYQDVNEYVELCNKNFNEHQFECATAGLKISEFLMNRLKNTPQGQKTSASNEDIFTMLKALAKRNAVSLTTLKQAEYHEKNTKQKATTGPGSMCAVSGVS